MSAIDVNKLRKWWTQEEPPPTITVDRKLWEDIKMHILLTGCQRENRERALWMADRMKEAENE